MGPGGGAAGGPVKVNKVLVVEDDPHIRRVINTLLTREGFLVVEAANGLDGLAATLKESPQCIVTDTMMPHMDGLAMLVQLAAKGCAVPAIVVSAAFDLPPMDKLAELHVVKVYKKPFPFDSLVSTVKDAVSGCLSNPGPRSSRS